MDITALRYIVKVAQFGSVSKAAEFFLVSQPNISKVIKGVEDEIGFQIFSRTSKGVVPTDEGKTFILKAEEIVNSFDNLNQSYLESKNNHYTLSITYPRAPYISLVVSKFISNYAESNNHSFDISVFETNTTNTIASVLKDSIQFGIVRYNDYERHNYLSMFEQNHLKVDEYYNYQMKICVSEKSPLRGQKIVSKEDLKDYISIIHTNPEITDTNLLANHFYFSPRRIKVLERGSQNNILTNLPNSYIFVSPVPKEFLKETHLIQIPYSSPTNLWYDAIIYKENHVLTKEEQELIGMIKDATIDL